MSRLGFGAVICAPRSTVTSVEIAPLMWIAGNRLSVASVVDVAISACWTAADADELAGASAVAFSWAPAFTPANRAASYCSSMHVATLGQLCDTRQLQPHGRYLCQAPNVSKLRQPAIEASCYRTT